MATGHSRLQSVTGTRSILKDRFFQSERAAFKGRSIRASALLEVHFLNSSLYVVV